MDNLKDSDSPGAVDNSNEKTEGIGFKKPILVGKIGRLPKKISQTINLLDTEIKTDPDPEPTHDIKIENDNENRGSQNINSTKDTEKSTPSFPYKEPTWSGIPKSDSKDYMFEVLKDGTIIETLNLMTKSHWVFGRLPTCDVYMQHPTISRYHAVLQYRENGNETNPAGFYIYDLGSTHGTFLNKNRLKPKVFARVQVGHMLKLGCSSRCYILNGPDNDAEEESEFTVTELKQKRADDLRRIAEEKLRREQEIEERKRKEEEKGVDWGLGEDADEETDLSENPYAQTTNEELYLDDPKKALRGYYEREGLDLEYDCSERGIGQFICKVELPLDDEMGRPIVAEVIHKGKKKEAVIQCALEACRILDRAGLLRQATHESRKRKAKNWEDNDFYDSDDDTFLDRTGSIEKKREKRMNAKLPPKAETYESLMEKEKSIATAIADIERRLHDIQTDISNKLAQKNTDEDDSLDSYMKELKDDKPDKHTLSKLKLELSQLKQQHANVIRLVNIAKPASLPPLVPQYSTTHTVNKDLKSKVFPIIGKRRKTKFDLPTKPNSDTVYKCNDMDDDDDDDNDEQKDPPVPKEENPESKSIAEDEIQPSTSKSNQQEVCTSRKIQDKPDVNSTQPTHSLSAASPSSSNSLSSDDEQTHSPDSSTVKSLHTTLTFKKFEKILKSGLPAFADKYHDKLEKILSTMKKLASNEDRMNVNSKILSAKERKVMKLISDFKNCEPIDRLELKVSAELNRITHELNIMTEQKLKAIGKVRKMGDEIRSMSNEMSKDYTEYKKEIKSNEKKDDQSNDVDVTEESNKNDDRKKKKNQKRNQHRLEKMDTERQRGYEEDANKEDYSMWVPPSNQKGDGRTDLNEKYGY